MPRRQFHVNFFNQIAVQKGRFDVALLRFPSLLCGKSKQQSQRFITYDWREGFVEVIPRSLSKPSCYQSCFVTFYRSVCLLFDFINPFAVDDRSFWSVDNFPSSSFGMSFEFFTLCLDPLIRS